jgi:hypothetical protein
MRSRLVAVAVAAVALLVAVASPASASGYVSSAWVTASKGDAFQVAAYLSGAGDQVSWGDGSKFVVAELTADQQPGAVTSGGEVPAPEVDTAHWGNEWAEIWIDAITFTSATDWVATLRGSGANVTGTPTDYPRAKFRVKCVNGEEGANLNGGVVSVVAGKMTMTGACADAGGIDWMVFQSEYSSWAYGYHGGKWWNPYAVAGEVGGQAWIPEAIVNGVLPIQLDYKRGACTVPGSSSCSGMPVFFVPGVDIVCRDGSAGGYVALVGGLWDSTAGCAGHGGVDYAVRATVADASGSWPGFRYYTGSVPLRTAVMCAASGSDPSALTLADGVGSPAPFVSCPAGRWAYSVIVSEPISGTVVVAGYFRDWRAHAGPSSSPTPVVPQPSAPPTPSAPAPSGCVDLGCVADSINKAVYDAVNGTTQAIYNLVICNEQCQNFDAFAKPMDQWAVKVKPWLDQITWVGGSFAPLGAGCSCGGYTFTLNMPAIDGTHAGVSHQYEILNTCSGWASTLSATSRAGTSLLLVLGTGAACIRFIAAAFSFVGLVDDFRGDPGADTVKKS